MKTVMFLSASMIASSINSDYMSSLDYVGMFVFLALIFTTDCVNFFVNLMRK